MFKPGEIYANFYVFISYALGRLLSIFEFILALRLLLVFANANVNTPIIGWFYGLTGIAISPFEGIFPNVYLFMGVLETPTIAAMVGYGIIVWIIVQILKIFSKYQ